MRASEKKPERVPLDDLQIIHRRRVTITIVVQIVGVASAKINQLEVGGQIFSIVVGPLGHESEIENFGTVGFVSVEGLGIAPVSPIQKSFERGGKIKVYSISGGRSKEFYLLGGSFSRETSDAFLSGLLMTGVYGEKGFVYRCPCVS